MRVPLKKPNNSQSTNADALLHQQISESAESEVWWLFELKTDQSSVEDDQLEPYERACGRRMSDLVADLGVITTASKTGAPKYSVLQQRLQEVGGRYDAPVRLVYLSPRPVPQLERIAGVEAMIFDDVLEVELDDRAAAWKLVRDHLLAPVVGR